MAKSAFISPYTQNALDSIKIAALYFDKLTIRQDFFYEIEELEPDDPEDKFTKGIVRGINPVISDEFVAEIKPLLEEEIIEVIAPSSSPLLNDDLKIRLNKGARVAKADIFSTTLATRHTG